MYNWEVITRVSMWMVHIKLKDFCWEEKFFLEQEKMEYIENFRVFILLS